MGKVVTQSSKQIRKKIIRKSINLFEFLGFNFFKMGNGTPAQQDRLFVKLVKLCESIIEDVSDLDEVNEDS